MDKPRKPNSRRRQGRQPAAKEVRDTGYGRGVFAAADIEPGYIIHVLDGETITSSELVHMVNSGSERIDDPLQVGMRTYIVLDGLSRSFNHSCNPNAGLRERSELFSLRLIRKGEEITYDYSSTIAPTVWQMRCRCGSANCRGILGDVRSIPQKQFQEYLAVGALQRYMKKLIAKPGWRIHLPKYESAALKALVKTSEK